MLLSPAELKKLDILSLQARRAFTGSSKGEKRSKKRGSSVEFADFRAYNHGDDLRRIDWNAYGRFEKLFLKMFLEEEDLDITLLIDASRSMSFGNPSKLRAALRVAGALGYVGLTNYDRVGAATYDATIRAWFPPTRGRNLASQYIRFLETQDVPHANGSATNGASGNETTDFAAAMRRVALQARRSGVAIVLSDFLLEDGYEAGLKTLAARGYEITAIQVLDRLELEPNLIGDLKLVDAESGATREVSISANLLRHYRQRLDNYCADLRSFCLRYGINYIQIANDTPLEDVVQRMLRGAGLVK